MDDSSNPDFLNKFGSDDNERFFSEGSDVEGLIGHARSPVHGSIIVTPCAAATALTFWMLLGMATVGFVWMGCTYFGSAGLCYGLEGNKTPQVCFLKKTKDNSSWEVLHNVRYFGLEPPRVEVGEASVDSYSPGQMFALAESSAKGDRVEWLVLGCLAADVYFVVYRECPISCYVNATSYRSACSGCASS